MVNKKTVAMYSKEYPDVTQKSIHKTLEELEKSGRPISAVTVDYYIRAKRFGGKGYGRLKGVTSKKRKILAWERAERRERRELDRIGKLS